MIGSQCGLLAQVIGDGAITGGMAYEAMNHAGFLDKNMIVILNDNQQVCDGLQDFCAKQCPAHLAGLLYCLLLQKRLACLLSKACLQVSQPYLLACSGLWRSVTRWCGSQVSLPTQYNGKNQDPVGALSSALARLQVRAMNE